MQQQLDLHRGLEREARGGKLSPASIIIRDLRFLRGAKVQRLWLGGDPVATAWFTALSATFPRGEAFFVEAVKAHRDGAPPQLAEQIRAFIIQEINHSREHLALNRVAEAAGYDLAGIDRHVAELLEQLNGRPAILDLATTMALEHFTAMMAHEFLAQPQHFAGADPEVAALWRWHAIEEIEHKAVAYDTYRHATQNWNRWKRWRLKSVIMLIVSKNFLNHRFHDALGLLAQDEITGVAAKRRLLAFLLWKPGVLRRIFPSWLAYFLPGFHPWNTDDRGLIAGAERDLEFQAACINAPVSRSQAAPSLIS
jgi:predicted metal-dependent hydrolase